MPRTLNRLTATGVAAINQKGRYADGGGLYLRVSPTISKAWVFRWVRSGTAREMGLGAYPTVSLASARKSASAARNQLADGLDPLAERNRVRELNRTFKMAVDDYLQEMSGRWTNKKTQWQWQHSLKTFAKPIHSRPIASIETADILSLLKPIWQQKPESAAKARMRLESILDYAKAKGWREGENPARWRGHLSNILPARKKHSKGHHNALPYNDMPKFWTNLQQREALAADALKLLILTATRTSEVLKATWDEFDLDKALWTIPAERMKMKRDHRIPLSDAAMEILRPLYEARTSEFVFPGQKKGKPLSNLAMIMMLRRMKREDITVHGFRSTFRDWCGDCTSFPREVAEAALAHKVGSDVEQAYRRSDALEKRRQLIKAWADFCLGKEAGKVVALHG